MQKWVLVSTLLACLSACLSACEVEPLTPIQRASSASNLNVTSSGLSPANSLLERPLPDLSGSIQQTTSAPMLHPTALSSVFPIEVVAGSGKQGFEDGPALQASFNAPGKPCFDLRDGSQYIPDTHMLRKLTPAGQVITVAGSHESGYRDGASSQARFNNLIACVVDAKGRVLLTDQNNRRIRQFTPETGMVSTYLGTEAESVRDGDLSVASLESPKDLYLLPSGELYLTDSFRIRKFAQGRLVTLNAAQKVPADRLNVENGQLPTTHNLFGRDLWFALDQAKNIYVSDSNTYSVRHINTDYQVETFSSDESEAYRRYGSDYLSHVMSVPTGIAYDQQRKKIYIAADGGFFEANAEGHNKRLIGKFSNGVNAPGFSGNSQGLIIGPDQNLYFAAAFVYQIQRMNFHDNPTQPLALK